MDELAPEQVSPELLRSAFREAESRIQESFFFHEDTRRIFLPRLRRIFESMLAAKRFRVMTNSIRSELGIDSYLCENQRSCREIYGFYNPLTHHIILRAEVPAEEFAKSLFHELAHAYQFIYRFPVDLRKLEEISAQGRYQREKIPEFISTFYELQAQFYGLKFKMPEEWRAELNPGLGKSFSWGLANAFTLGGWDRHWLRATNEFLPNIDRRTEPGFLGLREFSVLTAHELIPVGKTWTPSGFLDLKFHALFGESVTEAYFGSGPRALTWTREENQIQLELHDLYYEKLGQSHDADSGACSELLGEILGAESAPFISWLSMDPERAARCAIYIPYPSGELRMEFARLVLNRRSGGSPFIFRGGEGTRPDLPIFPVLPNLKVNPIRHRQIAPPQNQEGGGP